MCFRESQDTLVWRGVRENLSDLYPQGKEFAWWALSSCTASINVLESPNYLGKSGARTMFSIQTNKGKLIRAHSYFENEDEILLPPGMYLRVIGVLNPAEDLHIIQLREIPPPYPMLVEPFDLSKMKQALPSPPPSDISGVQKNYSAKSVAPKPAVQVSSKKGNSTVLSHVKKSSKNTFNKEFDVKRTVLALDFRADTHYRHVGFHSEKVLADIISCKTELP